MKVKVIDDKCISCGACVGIAPDIFEFNDEGISVANNDNISDDNIEDVRDSIESCPTDAIVEVN